MINDPQLERKPTRVALHLHFNAGSASDRGSNSGAFVRCASRLGAAPQGGSARHYLLSAYAPCLATSQRANESLMVCARAAMEQPASVRPAEFRTSRTRCGDAYWGQHGSSNRGKAWTACCAVAVPTRRDRRTGRGGSVLCAPDRAGVHRVSRQLPRTDALWSVLQAHRLHDWQSSISSEGDQLRPDGGDGAGLRHQHPKQQHDRSRNRGYGLGQSAQQRLCSMAQACFWPTK